MESTMKPTLLLDLNLLSNNNYLSSDGNNCCSLVSVSVSESPVASNSSKEQDNLSFTSTSSLALSSSSSSNCSTSPSSQSPPSSLCFKLREEDEEEEEDVEVDEERAEKNEENDILLSQISTSTSRPHFFSQFTSRNKIKRNKSLSFISLGPKITLTKKLSFSSKQHQLEQQQEQERQRYQQKNQKTKLEELTVKITTEEKSLPSKSKSMNRLLEVPLASSVKMISWFKEFKNRKTNSSKKSNDSSVATSNDENDSPSRVSLEQFTTVDSASSTSSIELTNDNLNHLNINNNSNNSNISSISSSSSNDSDNSNENNNCNNCDRNSSDDFETKNEAPANFKNNEENNNNNNNDSNITSIETNLPVRPLLYKPTKTWSPVSSSSSSASSSPSSISYLLPTYSFASPRSNNSNSFGGYYRSNSQIKTTNTVRTTPNSPRTAAYQPRPRFDPRSVQKLVLEWCQFHTKDYKNVNITNFSSSWSDGLAFCALIHNFLPDSFDYSRLESINRYENFELAFDIALKQANISPLLEVDDMIRMGNRPDDRCVYTYVSTIYSRFKSLKPMEKAK